MLKKRLIATLVVRNRRVVQSIGFRRYLPVGRPSVAVQFLNAWGIDEIILLDIDAASQRREPDYEMIALAARLGFVPMTVGGGIRKVEHIQKVLQHGADKVAINTAIIDDPGLVTRGAEVAGSQCIVVSIDVRRTPEGRYHVFGDSGRRPTGIDALDLARRVEDLGAGELLVNSIDRDGTKQGFDVELGRQMAERVRIPVILQGGAGHPQHFLDVFQETAVSAAAAANYFHFTEHSAIVTKAVLARAATPIRLETYASYAEARFDDDGRVDKKSDAALAELLFEFFPKEVI